MTLSRGFTRFFIFMFDNVIPPVLRDNRCFMWLSFYPLFGKKARYFMEFKEKAPFLTEEEYNNYYKLLADKHFERKTSLNNKTVKYIHENISGDTILDIACGGGYMVQLLAERFPQKQIFGIDIIVPELTKKSQNVFLKTGNIENIDFPDNYFDTVICAHTLEHVQNIDRAIAELRRVCRRKLIIVVPQQREYRYTFDLHLHFFPYLFSFRKIMRNSEADYRMIANDIVYTEDII